MEIRLAMEEKQKIIQKMLHFKTQKSKDDFHFYAIVNVSKLCEKVKELVKSDNHAVCKGT